ncbi:MAG: M13 family metallopeptidase [Flavobacteriales bacterium]|nr:M13 family metallopeptidase [Flavobacteriales bacterium]
MNKLQKSIFGLTTLSILVACGGDHQETETEAPKKEIIPAFDLSQIDSSANPCEDFEQYAVGNWLKNNPVPEAESSWGSFNIVHDENEIKLKAIVEEATSMQAKKGTPLQQVGDFYTSALDSTKVNELGIQPLQPILDQIDGVTNTQELVEMMAETRKHGSGSIFGYYVHIDSKNSSEYITYLSQGGLGLPDRDYYFPEDDRGKAILDAYHKHIAALFTLAGTDPATAEQQAKDVVALETELATRSMNRVERRDPEATYNKMDLAELQTICGVINWEGFFKAAEIDVTKVNELVVKQPDFLKALNKSLRSIPLDNWKTYMKWHLINDMADDLSIDFEKQKFDFYATTLRGIQVMKPRWKRALSKSNGTVGEQIGKLFVEKHFPQESKQKVLDLISNINKVFTERVQRLDWMGDSTKIKAIEKLTKFTYKIGYPDEWEDYSSVEITSSTLAQNVMNMNYFEYKKNVNRLGQPIDKKEWGMTPQTINAYYNPTMNEIVFPAAILQPPFFNADADDAINYGGIGAVIGHEFSHGFDDQGSKYDGDGNLNNWWTDEDRANFSERTTKLVNQFDAYTVAEDNHVNGNLTLGENIADLAGITLAYYALEKAMEGKKDPMVDGFTYQQRFFLGWAQVWHTNMKDEAIINLVKTNPHSPAKYRILGPLTNMVEFDQAFGCKEGNMVAKDDLRVTIW